VQTGLAQGGLGPWSDESVEYKGPITPPHPRDRRPPLPARVVTDISVRPDGTTAPGGGRATAVSVDAWFWNLTSISATKIGDVQVTC